MGLGTDSGRRILVACLIAVAGLWLVVSPAPAEAACSLSGGALALTADGRFGSAEVIRGAGPEISASTSGGFCMAGQTVDNVDRITFTDPVEGRASSFLLGASFSPAILLAPGRTDEGDGTSEIETEIDLGGDPGDGVAITVGGDSRQSGGFEIGGDDKVVLGQRGDAVLINMNGAVEAPGAQDADVSVKGTGGMASGRLEDGDLRIQTSSGTDVVKARGGRALGGVVTAPLEVVLQPGRGDKAVLGDGPDRLVGTGDVNVLKTKGGADTIRAGGGRDKINPGKGKDEVEGGPGNDVIRARDGKRDVIDCGAGKRDKVIADRKDEIKRCRKVKRKG